MRHAPRAAPKACFARYVHYVMLRLVLSLALGVEYQSLVLSLALGVECLSLVLSLALGVECLRLVPRFVLKVVGGVFVGFGADGV